MIVVKMCLVTSLRPQITAIELSGLLTVNLARLLSHYTSVINQTTVLWTAENTEQGSCSKKQVDAETSHVRAFRNTHSVVHKQEKKHRICIVIWWALGHDNEQLTCKSCITTCNENIQTGEMHTSLLRPCSLRTFTGKCKITFSSNKQTEGQ